AGLATLAALPQPFLLAIVGATWVGSWGLLMLPLLTALLYWIVFELDGARVALLHCAPDALERLARMRRIAIVPHAALALVLAVVPRLVASFPAWGFLAFAASTGMSGALVLVVTHLGEVAGRHRRALATGRDPASI